MRRAFCAAALLGAAAGLAGCDGDKPVAKEIKVSAPEPIVLFRNFLENYAKGQPITSEAPDVEGVIALLKQKDPAKGEIAEKGWAELLKVKGNPSAKAKELLAKLK